MTNEPIARKGSIMTCGNGHPLAELNSDLHRYDTNYTTKFINWRPGAEAVKGQQKVECPVCGDVWFDGSRPMNFQVKWQA